MCHLVLLMPLFGIGLFWVFPLELALPLYIAILIISGVVYHALMQAMKEPIRNGNQALLSQPVQVIEKSGRYWMVETHGELWQAESDEFLSAGQRAFVDQVNGMRLHIHTGV